MAETARRVFFSTLIVVGVVVAVLALWKLRLLIALLFFAFILAAAMRPGIEALKRRGIPRGAGIAIHYIAIAGLIGVLLWLAVPRAADQVQAAIGSNITAQRGTPGDGLETRRARLARPLASRPSKHDEPRRPRARGDEARLRDLDRGLLRLRVCGLLDLRAEPSDRARPLLVPDDKRRVVRDTWDLIDLKLGAYVRGQLILIVAVATVLSLAFWAIGLPYWLLVGAFAGIVEIVPVIGPLTAGALAVGVGLTESWELALAAGLIVLVVRLPEDYLVIPKVLGDAVGLSPLLVLVSVTATAILFGAAAVLLAIPLAAVLATLVSVIVLERDPAKEDVPDRSSSPAQDAEN